MDSRHAIPGARTLHIVMTCLWCLCLVPTAASASAPGDAGQCSSQSSASDACDPDSSLLAQPTGTTRRATQTPSPTDVPTRPTAVPTSTPPACEPGFTLNPLTGGCEPDRPTETLAPPAATRPPAGATGTTVPPGATQPSTEGTGTLGPSISTRPAPLATPTAIPNPAVISITVETFWCPWMDPMLGLTALESACQAYVSGNVEIRFTTVYTFDAFTVFPGGASGAVYTESGLDPDDGPWIVQEMGVFEDWNLVPYCQEAGDPAFTPFPPDGAWNSQPGNWYNEIELQTHPYLDWQCKFFHLPVDAAQQVVVYVWPYVCDAWHSGFANLAAAQAACPDRGAFEGYTLTDVNAAVHPPAVISKAGAPSPDPQQNWLLWSYLPHGTVTITQTAPAAFWDDPVVYCTGKDLQAGDPNPWPAHVEVPATGGTIQLSLDAQHDLVSCAWYHIPSQTRTGPVELPETKPPLFTPICDPEHVISRQGGQPAFCQPEIPGIEGPAANLSIQAFRAQREPSPTPTTLVVIGAKPDLTVKSAEPTPTRTPVDLGNQVYQANAYTPTPTPERWQAPSPTSDSVVGEQAAPVVSTTIVLEQLSGGEASGADSITITALSCPAGVTLDAETFDPVAAQRRCQEPVADAGFELIAGEKVVASGETDARGWLRFDAIPPGDITLVQRPPRGYATGVFVCGQEPGWECQWFSAPAVDGRASPIDIFRQANIRE